MANSNELRLEADDGTTYQLTANKELTKTVNRGTPQESSTSVQLTGTYYWGCQLQDGYFLVRLMSSVLLFTP
ncbi:MAG: hypothetical protein AB7G93_23160 [Bdellovibrionales bacterium]